MFLIIILGLALSVLAWQGVIDIPIWVGGAVVAAAVLFPSLFSGLTSLGANLLNQSAPNTSTDAVNSCGCTGLVIARDKGGFPRGLSRDRTYPQTCAAFLTDRNRRPGRYVLDGCA